MARIIYGVSGEGSGHSSRAKVIGQHLIDAGHELKILSYDKGLANLKDEFDVTEVTGLTIVSIDNKVSMVRTAMTNLGRLRQGLRCYKMLKALFAEFQPDCVITDFEPSSAYLARRFKLPLISIDNQHRMRYIQYERPPGLRKEAFITETTIKSMIPKPWVALTTSFHAGEPTNDRTFLYPPMIREAVRQLKPTPGQAILVYITTNFDSLLKLLPEFKDEQFVVYGAGREGSEGNVCFKPFSKTGFLEDLASAKAVMATAGFTLISEALHLGKPYLAFPMLGQFEQQLNAYMLEHMGYGAQSNRATKEQVSNFLEKLPSYQEALSQYPRSDNQAILAKLDSLLANDMEELLTYRR